MSATPAPPLKVRAVIVCSHCRATLDAGAVHATIAEAAYTLGRRTTAKTLAALRAHLDACSLAARYTDAAERVGLEVFAEPVAPRRGKRIAVDVAKNGPLLEAAEAAEFAALEAPDDARCNRSFSARAPAGNRGIGRHSCPTLTG